jgi:hypothetical protein
MVPATPSTGAPAVAGEDHPAATPSAPALPSEPARPAAPDDAGTVRTYTIGGIQVRDHRSGAQKPLDIPPNVHAPSARRLPSQLTHAISEQLKQVMIECAQDLPRPADGPHPRMEGQIVVGIKGGQMSIASSTMQLRGVSGPEVDATKSCIEQRSLGLTAPAADQADLDGYSIRVSFAIP